MTERLATPEPTSGPTPEPRPEPTSERKPRRIRVVAAVAVIALLVGGLVAYGVTQHAHAAKLAKQRDAARHLLSTTRSKLHQTQASLNDDESRLIICNDVGEATMQLFNAANSLNNAVSAALAGDYSAPGIYDAGNNIDRVTQLVHSDGYSAIQEFVNGCTNGGSGSGT